MAFSEDLQYKLENLSIYFQGGVRRSIIIAAGVSIVLLAPMYFAGKLIANMYANSYLELNSFAIKPVKNIYDYEIGKTNKATVKNGEVILYAAINNKKNIDVGYFPWNYSITVLDDQGNVITPKRTYSSYLLPNDNKYLIVSGPATAANLQIQEEPGTVKVNYNPNANPLQSIPSVTQEKERVVVEKDGTMTVTGVLRNLDRRRLEQVDVVFLVRNSEEEIVYAGSGSFNGFVQGTDREFNVRNLSLPKDSDPVTVNILWSTNYLNPQNLKIN